MESICCFEPFYKREDVVFAPRDALDSIRERSLGLYLRKHKRERPPPPSDENVVADCTKIIRFLLRDSNSDNTILQRLHQVGIEHQIDAMSVVEAALAMWYNGAIPVITRDPLQGWNPAFRSELQYDDNGEPFVPWSREYSATKHASANLGLVSILMTTDRWLTPTQPLLKVGSLISRSVTTLLYAAFLIAPRMLEEPWAEYMRHTRPEETMRAFLRSAWALWREDYELFDVSPPGIEFGVTLGEVKLTSDGMDLITMLGDDDWYCPDISHPIRKVPGSAWNKFLRNHKQPVFPESQSQAPGFQAMIPSSLLTLARPFEKYYFELRSRIDHTGRQRLIHSRETLVQQYNSLAEATGRRYPMLELSEDNATFTEEPDQDYLYKVPMIKKPIADLRGHLTPAFMNTLVRAWRFRQEPDEIEPDFHIMSFEH